MAADTNRRRRTGWWVEVGQLAKEQLREQHPRMRAFESSRPTACKHLQGRVLMRILSQHVIEIRGLGKRLPKLTETPACGGVQRNVAIPCSKDSAKESNSFRDLRGYRAASKTKCGY